MVARLVLAAAVCLTAVSCNSLFDSYFPETVEYLDSQVSLTDALGGKTVVSIQLNYLPATSAHGADILAVVAGTSDGGSHVLFYNPSNLSLRKSYTDDDLRAQNSGTVPYLGLIAQDSVGLYTGTLSYNPQTLAFTTTSYTGTLFVAGGLQGVRAAWNETVALSVAFGPSGGLGYSSDSLYSNLPSLSAGLVFSGGSFTVLDAAYVGGMYRVVASQNSSALLITGNGPATMGLSATESMGQSDSSGGGGWVTSGAAIVQSKNNNSTTLTAYSWSGDSLGTLHLYTANNQINALAFDPRGGSWYLFDSSTGKLSRNRPWW